MNGDPKRKGVPCSAGQQIMTDENGREWCCDKAAISGACKSDNECTGPNEHCLSKSTGQPCNGVCNDGQCTGGGQGANCRSCGPDDDCIDGKCAKTGAVCVSCGPGYYCAADGKCKKVGGGPAGCETSDDCSAGQVCVNGKCVPKKDVPGGGACTADSDCSTYCQGKPGICDTSTQKCRCTGSIPFKPKPKKLGPCPEGVGEKTYSGCACGREYTTMTGQCAEGYVHVPRSGTGWHGWKKGAVGRCECVKYCKENGYGSDCQGGGTVGEYKYPDWMQSLMKLFGARANALLQMPGGYSQSEINKMFGRGFENVRAQGAATREATEEQLSRAGMLGTGTATGTMANLASEQEGNITDLMRDIFLANQAQKRQDIKDYTSLAQGLFGTGMSYEQLQEAINAGRRGETRDLLTLYLTLLKLFQG